MAKKVFKKKGILIPASIVHNPNTASTAVKEGSLPSLTFEKLRHNFGEITHGETVSQNFSFTNTGEADLLISNAKGSCT